MAYPASLDSFTTKTDLVDYAQAAHMNALQTAITAVETELGTDPAGNLTDLKTRLAVSDSGWISASGTWAYASATTITVPSGAASIYSVGDKIKLTQTTVKYFYIVAVADTVLTVTGGSDYTVANAEISAVYFSKTRAAGFPDWFNLTGPTWTTSGTAFTNQPTNSVAKFKIEGKSQDIYIKAVTHATSGGTGQFIATFTAGQLADFANAGSGSAYNHTAVLAGIAWVSTTAQDVIKLAKVDGTALAGNNETFTATVRHEI